MEQIVRVAQPVPPRDPPSDPTELALDRRDQRDGELAALLP